MYENGNEAAKTYTSTVLEGNTYSVTSPTVPGFKPDKAVVSGTMPTGGIDPIKVTYSEPEYTLTVRFVSMADGRQVAAPVTMSLKYGDNYTVFAPAVEGYTMMKDKVTGVMSDNNHTVTVLYVPEGSEYRNYKTVEIDDFGTPLGIADSIMGGGEIIE